jgi:hypothetical protein
VSCPSFVLGNHVLVSCQALPVHLFKSTIGVARALPGAKVLISKQAVSWALTEAEKSKAVDVVIRNVRMILTDGAGPVEEFPLERGGGSIPTHGHRRPQALQNFALSSSTGAVRLSRFFLR